MASSTRLTGENAMFVGLQWSTLAWCRRQEAWGDPTPRK